MALDIFYHSKVKFLISKNIDVKLGYLLLHPHLGKWLLICMDEDKDALLFIMVSKIDFAAGSA